MKRKKIQAKFPLAKDYWREIGFSTLSILIFVLPPLIILHTPDIRQHTRYELYPAGTSKHWLGKWINTSVSHNMHHHYFKGNYGLYFLFWDRMMGTLRKDYDDNFNEVTTRKNLPENA